jgi:hypothetical protein
MGNPGCILLRPDPDGDCAGKVCIDYLPVPEDSMLIDETAVCRHPPKKKDSIRTGLEMTVRER